MFPRSLMIVTGSTEPAESLKPAIALALEHGCHLAVTVVGIALPPPVAIYGVIPAEAWTEERKAGNTATTQKAEEIEQALAKAGVSGDVIPYFCDASQVPGIAGTRAQFADLALLQTGPKMDSRLHRGVLEGFLFESARPYLVFRAGKTPSLKPKTVVVAWNGSREAARAVHYSLDIIAGASAVHVVMADPVAREYEHGDQPGSDLALYLARHGAKVSVDVISAEGREPAEAIARHARDAAADMIVAGAYGHSRLREYLFGGTTKSLLEDAEIPVLMAH